MADELARGVLVQTGREAFKGSLSAALTLAGNVTNPSGDYYSPASWAALQAAIEYGQAVLADQYAGEFLIDKATRDILAAIAGLTPYVQSLFAGGVEGAWLSQEDAATRFQDTTARLPAVSDGQSEGLILDKRLGIGRGVVNLLGWSEDLTNGAWFFAGEVTLSPSQYLEVEASTGRKGVQASLGMTDGAVYSRYGDVKPIGRRYVCVSIRGFGSGPQPSGTPGGNWNTFDTVTGSWLSSNSKWFAVDLGGGYWRLGVTNRASSADNNKLGFTALDTNNSAASFTGDSTKGLEILRMQYERGSLPTEYQKRSGGGSVLPENITGNNAYQSTSLAKMTYNTDGVYHWASLDGDDDSINFNVPAGGWNGTYVQGTMAGVIVGQISVPEGVYQIPTNASYANAGTMTELVIRNDGGVIDQAELEQLVDYVGRRGSAADFAGETSLNSWFQLRSDITRLDCSRWDVSQITNFALFAFQCSTIEELDVSNWDTSQAITFLGFLSGCTSLTAIDVSNWDTSGVLDFSSFVRNCALITALDVSNWDTSSVTNFAAFAFACASLTTLTINGGTGSPFSDSPCTNYANAFANTNLTQQSYEDLLTAIDMAGTSNGTLTITGGSATTTGPAKTAVDNLRARGWTVTTPDGY